MEFRIEKDGNISIPAHLFADIAITFNKLADKFNCNDGQLDAVDLDWAYYHKINKRVQYIIDNTKVITHKCYIVDEDDWDNTYDDLGDGNLSECAQFAKDELERLIEEFDYDVNDYKEELDTLDKLINTPDDVNIEKGYKPFYCVAPLGYSISIE